MQHFTPVPSLVGGILIGLAALSLLFSIGQIAGVSGIVAGLLRPGQADRSWRLFFLLGLVGGGVAMAAVRPEAFRVDVHRSPLVLVAAGLLVGFGARLGGGCTSGHGVCGIGRLSTRSIVATMVFMTAASIVNFVVNRVFGGSI